MVDDGGLAPRPKLELACTGKPPAAPAPGKALFATRFSPKSSKAGTVVTGTQTPAVRVLLSTRAVVYIGSASSRI